MVREDDDNSIEAVLRKLELQRALVSGTGLRPVPELRRIADEGQMQLVRYQPPRLVPGTVLRHDPATTTANDVKSSAEDQSPTYSSAFLRPPPLLSRGGSNVPPLESVRRRVEGQRYRVTGQRSLMPASDRRKPTAMNATQAAETQQSMAIMRTLPTFNPLHQIHRPPSLAPVATDRRQSVRPLPTPLEHPQTNRSSNTSQVAEAHRSGLLPPAPEPKHHIITGGENQTTTAISPESPATKVHRSLAPTGAEVSNMKEFLLEAASQCTLLNSRYINNEASGMTKIHDPLIKQPKLPTSRHTSTSASEMKNAQGLITTQRTKPDLRQVAITTEDAQISPAITNDVEDTTVCGPPVAPQFLLDQGYDRDEALGISILAHVRDAANRIAHARRDSVRSSRSEDLPFAHINLEDEQELLSDRFRWHEKYGSLGMRSSVHPWQTSLSHAAFAIAVLSNNKKLAGLRFLINRKQHAEENTLRLLQEEDSYETCAGIAARKSGRNEDTKTEQVAICDGLLLKIDPVKQRSYWVILVPDDASRIRGPGADLVSLTEEALFVWHL